MDSIYLVAYTTILIFTILIPSFLLGRIAHLSSIIIVQRKPVGITVGTQTVF